MPSQLGLHPALNSFIQAYTARRGQVRQDERDQKFDEQQKVENDLREKRFQEEMKNHQAEIDHRNKVYEMNQKFQHLQAKKTLSDLVRMGAVKPTENSGSDSQVSVPGQLPQPDIYDAGGYKFSTAEIGSPQEQGKAVEEFNAPLLNRKYEDAVTLGEQNAANRMAQALAQSKARAEQEAQRQKFTEAENAKKIAAQRDIASGRNATILQGANIRAAASKSAGGSNPEVPKYWDTVATGQAPIDVVSQTKNERAKATEYAATNGIGYYTKQDETNAKPLVKVLGDYKKMKEFVDDLSDKDPAPDGISALKRRAKFSNQTFATMGSASDLYRKYNTEIIPAVAAFGRTVGERGAFTEKDAAKYKSAMVGPHQADGENYKTLQFMYDGAVRAVRAQFPNIKEDHIEQFLEDKYKITPPEKMDFTPGPKLGKREVINGVTYILQPNGKYKALVKAEDK